MRQEDEIGGWCILRTTPSRTVPLTVSLSDAGFDVWTPIEVQVSRVGRARKRVERACPIVPAIVFGRHDRLTDLITLSRSPALTYQVWDAELRRMVTKGCPYFTVFRDNGRYPIIRDNALDPLRRVERRSRPKVDAHRFKEGEEVQYPDAGFEGLVGTVEGVQGRYSLVRFPGFPIAVKIDARYLTASAKSVITSDYDRARI